MERRLRRHPDPYLSAAAFRAPGSIDNPVFGKAPRTLAGARSSPFAQAGLAKYEKPRSLERS